MVVCLLRARNLPVAPLLNTRHMKRSITGPGPPGVICSAAATQPLANGNRTETTRDLDRVVQSLISANPGLTLNKTYGVNPGLAQIGL